MYNTIPSDLRHYTICLKSILDYVICLDRNFLKRLLQVLALLGISETERTRRKESNHLTTKINFIAWLLEVF